MNIRKFLYRFWNCLTLEWDLSVSFYSVQFIVISSYQRTGFCCIDAILRYPVSNLYRRGLKVLTVALP